MLALVCVRSSTDRAPGSGANLAITCPATWRLRARPGPRVDVVMPGGQDGFNATRTIAKSAATKHIPIIICSTKGRVTDKIWGMRQGAKGYLVKPIKAAELLQKITELG